MNTIWYLLIFGLDWNTSQALPQATREACMQQAAWVNGKFDAYTPREHAFCVSGLPR